MGETVVKHSGFKKLAIETMPNDDDRSDKMKGLSLEQKISSLLNTLEEDKIYEKEYGTFMKGMFYGAEQLQDFKEAVLQLEKVTESIQ